ncbi:PAS domain-containing protein [Shewanella sp. VB17]|uniref:methyl-accepting chemotaxis protein n=1 Tax=Shewanella sp. VB17 TaxID=2739432 RepID=UPI00156537ED|nr:methyl-accepting chemotaxis protein [Shewanella sp. VB17]NRD75708.1 PAS domain-containing protein [Shewanella sp. VB17]
MNLNLGMLNASQRKKLAPEIESKNRIEAMNRVQAIIEFELDGTIITANDNFLSVMGYKLQDIVGKHHSIFVDSLFAKSQQYNDFWKKLNQGQLDTGEYKRLGKSGKEVWLQASYNPLLDDKKQPYRIMKIATDVTQQRLLEADRTGEISAIRKSYAVIEFNMDGTVIQANDIFLNVMGYHLDEVEGKHHSMFVDSEFSKSQEYRLFWETLNRGEFQRAEYKRLGKGGKEVWIQASYNPIFDLNGKPFKVVKFAIDITEQCVKNADFSGQISAISKSQAVIEFNMDGSIIQANDNFLSVMGYSLDEVQGQRHNMFVSPEFSQSQEYALFWEALNRGEFKSAEYKRLGKGGKEVWIQATYNPIFDLNGKPFKVVKFATDVTAQKRQTADYIGQIDAIGKAQAVIEFNMDGTILAANDNFLSVMGYSLDEVQGQRHSMFVSPEFSQSQEYALFWEALNRGEFKSAEYKRLGKGGKEVWIQASYNPIFDLNGQPFKVVKFATDVTKQRLVNADYLGQIDAIGKAQAVIEFNMDGIILQANDNFLSVMGYSLEEVQGKHHRMFVDPQLSQSREYTLFWETLNRGEFQTAEYKRLGKGGKEVWIQASYNPIFDLNGQPFKVVKFASDVTEQRLANADYLGQIDAIGKALAVIEFNMDGTILKANDNFLSVMGYSLEEVQGKHHRMFVDPQLSQSREYTLFWETLNRGEFQSAEYKRLGKGGKEVWIQASYNPIFDLNGRPFKVVKFATDVTEQRLQNADYLGQIDAIGKSQAVIEFNMDGTIIQANDNFLNAMGYRLDEIKGKHHSMFVETAFKASTEYQEFWKKLNRGEFDSNEYQRVGKGGKEIWIQASYNPIMDLNGRPVKVVKYATDVTERKQAISQISKVIIAMSKGDLTTTIDTVLGSDFSVLGNIMNDLLANLNNMISEIRDVSNNVFDSSNELAQGNINLSQRTEEQAASLEETSTTIEQLAVTVQQNADNASQATTLTHEAMNKASKGGVVVENAVTAMEEIETSSKKISDIISVIDEIAFQTNLLALNAAVEAARAGEQGRGFAVVAAEVRNLSQRSASAAKEIKALINESVGAVAKGCKLVGNTGATFSELIHAVQNVVTMISNIDSASKEQALGINEVSIALAQIDDITQQNAALVEESTASSQAIEMQAKALLNHVAFFTTHDTSSRK